ncbi:MAG: MBL fold metallo-hydrolase [Erysipelotrichaceae bacterium]|nr:MBL fold metallo-hydrolase [Erysipelotrichaceae bacterium]
MMNENRYIKSNLKSKKIVWEEEKPIRWSYMKILREFSTLKKEYPVNPYAEVYQMRDNMWAIFTETLDGAGDPWMYLIDGPKKAMLIDTGFGVGDLKGLVKEIVKDKPLIVACTHAHYDHAYGNAQFEEIYCSKCEVQRMNAINNDKIWDYLFDENGKPKWTEFDRRDLIKYQPYKITGVADGHRFDLGDGYEVEAVLLPGHTPGQCGYLDLYNMTLFSGDTSGISKAKPGELCAENCTVLASRNAFKKLQPRFKDITGVFPGHGALDVSSVSLQYHLDACEAILKDPENYDTCKERYMPSTNTTRKILMKNIHQGTAIRYTLDTVR